MITKLLFQLKFLVLFIGQGGIPGAASLRDCKILESMVNKQAAAGRFYAAICAAPAVALGSWGLLKEKKVNVCCTNFWL